MKLKAKLSLLIASLAAANSAFAQAKAPEPDYTLSFNVGAVNDYRFRGMEQTSGAPSIQGGLDFAHKSGFYLGAWGASNLKWIKEFNGSKNGDYELDLYGGYKGELAKDLTVDVGLITYQYPGNDSGDRGTPGAGAFSKADTTEIYVGLTYNVLTFKLSHSTGDFLGNLNSSGSRYYDLSATFDLGNGISLTPHVGRQTIPNQNTATTTDGSAANYTDYALTIAKDFGMGLSISAAAIGTDAKENGFYQTGFNGSNRFLGKNGLVVGAKYSF